LGLIACSLSLAASSQSARLQTSVRLSLWGLNEAALGHQGGASPSAWQSGYGAAKAMVHPEIIAL
jgi:hypothetical protein